MSNTVKYGYDELVRYRIISGYGILYAGLYIQRRRNLNLYQSTNQNPNLWRNVRLNLSRRKNTLVHVVAHTNGKSRCLSQSAQSILEIASKKEESMSQLIPSLTIAYCVIVSMSSIIKAVQPVLNGLVLENDHSCFHAGFHSGSIYI